MALPVAHLALPRAVERLVAPAAARLPGGLAGDNAALVFLLLVGVQPHQEQGRRDVR